MNFRKLALLLCFCGLLSSSAARGQARISATTIPADQLLQPGELAKMLQSAAVQPLVLQVGSRVMFGEAHIRGSRYVGPASMPAGLSALEATVASLPKDRLIVLYCGCCPWGRCPNMGPAMMRMRELGFKNVKALYLPDNFGDDWVSKGYPTEHGQ